MVRLLLDQGAIHYGKIRNACPLWLIYWNRTKIDKEKEINKGSWHIAWSHERCSGSCSKPLSLKTSENSLRNAGHFFSSMKDWLRTCMASSLQVSGQRENSIRPAFQLISGLCFSNQSYPRKILLVARLVTAKQMDSVCRPITNFASTYSVIRPPSLLEPSALKTFSGLGYHLVGMA